MASARKGYGPITSVLLGDSGVRPVAPEEEWEAFRAGVEDRLSARVVAVNRNHPLRPRVEVETLIALDKLPAWLQ